MLLKQEAKFSVFFECFHFFQNIHSVEHMQMPDI